MDLPVSTAELGSVSRLSALQDEEGIRVLHVDDEQDFADIVSIYLERESNRLAVCTETSAAAGLDRLGSERIDCVVSDYEMPRTDGLEFLESVRAEFPNLPFILFTGKGSEEIASKAVSRGATDYLQKQRGTEQYTVLANRIENAVEQYYASREVERGFHAIETAQEGISFLDEQGRFLYVNPAYADTYGYDREQLIGEHWEIIYPDAHVSQVYDEILPSVPADGKWTGESIHRAKDGRRLVVNHALSYCSEGTLLCFIQDITEQKELERTLERERWRFEQFGSVISHDLRTPLRTAQGRLELARETGEKRHLEQAEAALDRLGAIVSELAEVMRDGEIVSEVTSVDVAETCRQRWDTLGTDGATLTVESGGSIRCDEAAFRRLVGNLLENALEHGGENVTVGLAADRFYIEDDGPGLPDGERDRVFETGYSTKEGSHGFGMASVQQICIAHGWEITATEGQDGGARFEISGIESAE